MAIEEVRKEVKGFILGTQSPYRYTATIISLDRLGGRGNIGEITKVINSLLGDVAEPRVYEILKRLVDVGIIEKNDDEYLLPKDEPSRKG